MMAPECRSCGTTLGQKVLDLGVLPLANALLSPKELSEQEARFPLALRVCPACWLMQIEKDVDPQILFRNYPYHSSFASSWLAHTQSFAEQAQQRLALDKNRFVMEIGSNDGCLLQSFKDKGMRVLGIDPADSAVTLALTKDIPTRKGFFGKGLADQLLGENLRPDLIVANNVLAHVPQPKDFLQGVAHLLAPGGSLTLEFPHLLRLLEDFQFDTLYHEHFSYFSLRSAQRLLEVSGLKVWDVEEIPTHGGSLRLWAEKASECIRPVSPSLDRLKKREEILEHEAIYSGLQGRLEEKKQSIRSLLLELKKNGKQVVGYGAPAKATVLLNVCEITTEEIPYTVDRNPYKQGKWIPGCRIPILDPGRIRADLPDYVAIFPWNLLQEIKSEYADLQSWGGQWLPLGLQTELPS